MLLYVLCWPEKALYATASSFAFWLAAGKRRAADAAASSAEGRDASIAGHPSACVFTETPIYSGMLWMRHACGKRVGQLSPFFLTTMLM